MKAIPDVIPSSTAYFSVGVQNAGAARACSASTYMPSEAHNHPPVFVAERHAPVQVKNRRVAQSRQHNHLPSIGLPLANVVVVREKLFHCNKFPCYRLWHRIDSAESPLPTFFSFSSSARFTQNRFDVEARGRDFGRVHMWEGRVRIAADSLRRSS